MAAANKQFTPQEANKRLPLIKKIVADILEKGQALKIAVQNTDSERAAEVEILQAEIESLMFELQELGCYFKDWNFEIGLVDFPAVIDNEDVLLCWRSDEPAVEWYHPLRDGYAGRRRIPQSLLDQSMS
ncbi:MAG: DUF2203 domain-containing protein [Candidatus Omnitrophica bacterium]|nr:DUF2203 domain-containing protein [Candidatus Omnitrophota bacterium]